MAIIVKPYTFSAGATIVASEHNSNFDTLYSDYNGNITNANIATGASIADTKLAQITTSGKVTLGALSVSGQTKGDLAVYDTAWTRLAASTSGYLLVAAGAAALPVWTDMTKRLTGMLANYTVGTDTINGSYNCADIVQDSTGNFTVSFTTNMNNDDYVPLVVPGSTGETYSIDTLAVGSFQVHFRNATTGAAVNPTTFFVGVFPTS